MKTTYMANANTVQHNWYVIDATDVVLGRLATEVATMLRGKNKPTFTPHVDCGDYVIVVNAEKVKLTGKKLEDKMYYHASGFPGGLKSRNAETMLELQPQKVIEKAVRGMLPKGSLGEDMYRKLFVYAGSEHPHMAQKPEKVEMK